MGWACGCHPCASLRLRYTRYVTTHTTSQASREKNKVLIRQSTITGAVTKGDGNGANPSSKAEPQAQWVIQSPRQKEKARPCAGKISCAGPWWIKGSK